MSFIGKNNGLLFKNNDLSDLINTYKIFQSMKLIDISKKIKNAKRKYKKYSIFSHYKELTKIL